MRLINDESLYRIENKCLPHSPTHQWVIAMRHYRINTYDRNTSIMMRFNVNYLVIVPPIMVCLILNYLIIAPPTLKCSTSWKTHEEDLEFPFRVWRHGISETKWVRIGISIRVWRHGISETKYRIGFMFSNTDRLTSNCNTRSRRSHTSQA